MTNAYQNTFKKLTTVMEKITFMSMRADWKGIAEIAETLTSYKDCFYCVDYRDTLEGHFSGCCKRCPCHTLGEKILGRTRAYNGCYVSTPYREMVRKATWFRTEQNEHSASSLINAIQENLKYMVDKKSELDI